MENITKLKKVCFILFTVTLMFFLRYGSCSVGKVPREGAVLHAWCWKFKDVSEYIDEIKEAGYIGVQVSPVQLEKQTKESPKVFSSWWAFYQPLNFKVGNSLGTEAEFKKMCADAHERGIKVIVDIVANHLANDKGFDKSTGVCDYSREIDAELLRLGDELFHKQTGDAFSEKNRLSYTQRSIGMPDLNTSSKQLQDIIIKFLNHLQELGTDGFRFDAARHIELPCEYDGPCGSDFWPSITTAIREKDPDSYIYGEVLDDGGVTNQYGYLKYMNLTENLFGIHVCEALKDSKPCLIKPYSITTCSKNLVTWVESHDTYAENGKGPTFDLTDEQLKIGWAVTASREGTVPLFLVRPSEDKLSRDKKEVLTGVMGGPGNLLWHENTIVQINKFKQCMSGISEYVRIENDKLFIVERGSEGMVIINFSAESMDLSQKTNLKFGKYIDKVSRSDFYVHDGTITGKIQPHGVVVLYDPEPSISVSQEGKGFKGKLELVVNVENATDVSYAIGGEEAVPLPQSGKIKIEREFEDNETFLFRVFAKTRAKIVERTYKFKKLSEKYVSKVNFRGHIFEDPYIYFYSNGGQKFFREYAKWPGVPMNKLQDGSFEYVIPDGWNEVKVLISDHGCSQIPGESQEGISINLGETLTIFEDGSYTCEMERNE